jgi:hypothetical protein
MIEERTEMGGQRHIGAIDIVPLARALRVHLK